MRVVGVFGGGGAKSIACAGAWRAMAEAGLVPSHLVGTSMGAVVAAAFASGATYDEVVIAARSLSQRDVAPIDPLGLVKGAFASHLLKPAGPRRVIERLVPASRWEDLKIPLTVTATDLDSGELVLFGAPVSPSGIHPTSPSGIHRTSSGNHPTSSSGRHPMSSSGSHPTSASVGLGVVGLHDALYASCALPVYFPPATVDGRRLADGGLRAVVGLDVAACIPADLVIAVHVGPGFDEPPPPPSTARHRLPPPLLRAHGEAIRVMMAAQVDRMIREWPEQAARLVVVRPVAEREATFAVDELGRYVEAGYRETKRALAEVMVRK
jgi:NTE family protein